MGNRTIRDFEENGTIHQIIDMTMRNKRCFLPIDKLCWIPISERLPEEGQLVLACKHNDYNAWVDIVFSADGMFFDTGFNWAKEATEYDAWTYMPLPLYYASETQP